MLWLGSLAAVLLSVGLDLVRVGGAAALALLGGAALLSLPLPLLAALARVLPRAGVVDRSSPYALAVAVAAPPAGLAAIRLVPTWPAPVAWVLPAVLAAGGALFVGALLLSRRPAGEAGARLRASALVAALALAALFLWVHLGEGTFAAVRPGTGPLHAALYFGTWAASAALLAPWAAAMSLDQAEAVARRQAEAVARRARLLLGAGSLVAGAALLAADRRVLVDLYPGVHRWLNGTGLLSVASGAALLLGARASAPWRAARLAALGALLLASALFAALGPALSPGGRAALAGASTGKILLGVLGPVRRAGGPLPAHPLLTVDQRLDAGGPPGDLNFLLVTVDALRADQVDAPRRLGAFARESIRFRRAYTQGTRTALAMSALMLGRYCASIDFRLMIYRRGALIDPGKLTEAEIDALDGRFVYTTVPLNPDHGMLAERLQRAGFWTAATPFAGQNEFFHKGGDFDQGFDRFADLTSMEWQRPTSGEVVKVAIAALDEARDKARWFQWVHFYDPHEAGGDAGRYAHYVKALDASFGALLDALVARGLAERTMIIVTADHGEALGEHNHKGHSTSLYEEQARVPLLVRVPGAPGRDVREPVALIDINATLLAAAGADTRGIDGVNLWPVIARGDPPASRPVFTELHRYYSNKGVRTTDLKGVVLGDWKLIQDRMRGTEQLFHLGEDPAEGDNRIAREPARADELRAVLDSFVSRAEAAHPLP